jgi:D-alanine-D-alanine ligase
VRRREVGLTNLVLVVFGGDSWEREGSIISAGAVARALDRVDVKNRLIEFPIHSSELVSPTTVVFNSIHGKNGEDGALSAICEVSGIPYNFSRPVAHLLCFDKLRFRSLAYSLGVTTPTVLPCLAASGARYPLPLTPKVDGQTYIMKPVHGGGSLGVQVLLPQDDIVETIASRETKYDPFYIEEFIHGAFVTCAISGDRYIDASLPLLEVCFNRDIYNYEAKHNINMRTYFMPARITAHAESIIREWSLRVFDAASCGPIVRFDFIVQEGMHPFLLEANTVPGLSEEGNLTAIWKHSGRSYDDMIAFLLQKVY